MIHRFQSRILQENMHRILQYAYAVCSSVAEVNIMLQGFEQNPKKALSFIESYFMDNRYKQNWFLTALYESSLISVEVGRRNSGKTVFNLWAAEKLYNAGFDIFYINPDFAVPDFVKEVRYDPKYPYLEVVKCYYPEVESCETYTEMLDYLRRNAQKNGTRTHNIKVVLQ